MNGKLKKIAFCLIPIVLFLFGCASSGASVFNELKPLQGFWKCKEHLNYRIEIKDDNLILLFLSRPIFETKITGIKTNGSRHNIILEKTRIFSNSSASAHPTRDITAFYYEDGILHYHAEGIATYNKGKIDDYTFNPTTESRYGDVTIRNDILRELQGTWKDEKETVSFIIKDNMIKIDRDKEIPIVVTETNSGYKKRFTIRPADAGESNFISLTYLYYNGEVITGSYMIMDANSPELIFRKAD